MNRRKCGRERSKVRRPQQGTATLHCTVHLRSGKRAARPPVIVGPKSQFRGEGGDEGQAQSVERCPSVARRKLGKLETVAHAQKKSQSFSSKTGGSTQPIEMH